MKSFAKKLLCTIISATVVLSSVNVAFAVTSNPKSVNAGLSTDEKISQEYDRASQVGATDTEQLVEGKDFAEGEILICATPSSFKKGLEVGDTDKSFEKQFDISDGEIVSDNVTVSDEVNDAVLYKANTDEDIVDYCEEINKESDVYFAQPNYAYTACEYDEPDEITDSRIYNKEQDWWMEYLNVPEAWEYSNGSMGKDVTVAIVDSGCNTAHEELQNHFWSHPKDSSVCGYYAYADSNLYVGDSYNCVNAHGTHVCGSIGMGNNNGGYLGTGCESNIMVMKADRNLGEATFYASELIKSVNKAVEYGADIISMSYGSYNFDLASLLTYEKAATKAVLVAAAGNDKYDATEKLHFPSAYSCIIGVMATGNSTHKNKLASFSNYDTTNTFYKVAAPGTDIKSCSNEDNSGYKNMSGTSMATPIVSGLIASYMSYIRSLGYDWSPAQYQYMIENTVNEKGNVLTAVAYNRSTQKSAYTTGYRFKMLDLLYLMKNGTNCPQSKEVAITNEELRNAVKEATGLTKVTNFDIPRISYIDMKNLSVDAVKEMCNTLTGIQYFNAYDNLNLRNYVKTNGYDEFLGKLGAGVFCINLAGTQIEDLSPFADYDFVCLNELDISGNVYIKDISALSKYKAIANLNISSTGVSDISAVGCMENIYSFNANHCSIYDATPIQGNKQMKICNLSHNKISDVDALSSFQGISLDISENYITADTDSDWEDVCEKIYTQMENANKDDFVYLMSSNQKSAPKTYYTATKLTMDSRATISRADYANKRLSDLLNVSVTNDKGNAAKIYPAVKWSGSNYTYALNSLGKQMTVSNGLSFAKTTTFTLKASLANNSTVKKTVYLTVTAPTLRSVSIADKACTNSQFTFSAVTQYADRLLITDEDKELFEVDKTSADVVTDSNGKSVWTFTVPKSKISSAQSIYVYAGDELGYSIGETYGGNFYGASSYAVSSSLSAGSLAHNYVVESETSATCKAVGKIVKVCTDCGEKYEKTSFRLPHNSYEEKVVEPTCTAGGYTTFTCNDCSKVFTENVIKALGHDFTQNTKLTPASFSKKGSKVVTTYCARCGYSAGSKTIATYNSPSNVKLSTTSYTYNGKVRTPSVIVTNTKGSALRKNTDYTVTYQKGRKNVGKYAVKVTFKGNYSGSKTVYFTIKPKGTSVSKISAGKKKFTVKWKKLSAQITGYQIQYSTNSKFKKGNKTVTVKSAKSTSKTVSKLKAKKKYYVRVRTYKKVGKINYYSSWSKAKSVKTKK